MSKIENLYKIEIIFGFLLIIVSTIIAWNTPKIGFEISIYESTPLIFWISLTISYIICFTIIYRCISGKNPSKLVINWTFLLLIYTTIMLISIYIIRGYNILNIMGDSGSHIGNLYQLLETGYIDSYYPLTYIYTISAHYFTDLEILNLVNYHTLIIASLVIISLYLLSCRIFSQDKEKYLLIFITLLMPFGSTIYMTGGYSFAEWVPTLSSIPILIFCVYTLLKIYDIGDNFNPKYRLFIIILLIFATSLILTHVLSAVMLLLFILSGIIARVILKMKIATGYVLLSFSAIIIIFIEWIMYANLMRIPVSSFYHIIFDNTASNTYINEVGNQFDFLSIYSLYDLTYIGIMNIGLLVIMITTASISIFFIRDKTYNKQYLLSGYIFVSVLFFIFILATIGSFYFVPGRISLYITICCIVGATISLSKLMERYYHKFMMIIPVLIVISLIILSIISYYPAIDTMDDSADTPDSTLYIWSWYFVYSNLDHNLISSSIFAPDRYLMYLYHKSSISNIKSSHSYVNADYIDKIVSHFGYNNNSYVGDLYTEKTYFLSFIASYQYIKKSYLWHNQEIPINNVDRIHINFDKSLNKIYNNNEAISYLIQ